METGIHRLSEEQQNPYRHLKNGSNVITVACAGAGKTTTVINTCAVLSSLVSVMLTYNSHLRKEVKMKAASVPTLHVHTYHSFATMYYDPNANDDFVLKQIVNKNRPPIRPLPPMNLLICDECQDMTQCYSRFVKKILLDSANKVQLWLLGDPMQSIYDFKGSNAKFLTRAANHGYPNLLSEEFVETRMMTSFRITKQIADYVNKEMLGEDMLKAVKEGTEVEYIINNQSFNDVNASHAWYVATRIEKLIREEKVSPEQIFILTPSLKDQEAIRLENYLAKFKIPFFYPPSNSEKIINEEIIKGKIVISTFHSSKGLERDHVFVLSFNRKYFAVYNKESPQHECPNLLYVAATRAKVKLYLVDTFYLTSAKKEVSYLPMPYLKSSITTYQNKPYVELIQMDNLSEGKKNAVLELRENNQESQKKRSTFIKITPSESVKFMSEATNDKLETIVNRILVKVQLMDDYGDLAFEDSIQSIIKMDFGKECMEIETTEEVNELNGIVIPQMFFWKMYGFCDTSLLNVKKHTSENPVLNEFIKKLPESPVTAEDFIKYAIAMTCMSRYISKVYQLQRYDWLNDEEKMGKIYERMSRVFQPQYKQLVLEEKLLVATERLNGEESSVPSINKLISEHFPNQQYVFEGRLDCVVGDMNEVYELKYMSKMNLESKLQTVMYAWLWRHIRESSGDLSSVADFRLFNIRTGEMYYVDATMEELNEVVLCILKNRQQTEEIKMMTDEEFDAFVRNG